MALFAGLGCGASPPERRPNIVWVIAEDISPHFGCYGEGAIRTPNVDRLAASGVRFDRAFTTGPVCSTSRSALITGIHQNRIGAHHHRSGRAVPIELPDGVELVPRLFQRAGYYTANGRALAGGRAAKTDYNFDWDRSVYDGSDWSGRAPGQPFFAQVQLIGGKARHDSRDYERIAAKLANPVERERVKLPPYYPDDPVLREDWAHYLDTVQYADWELGQLLGRLEDEGILGDTYVFFTTDHGISHARGKLLLYDEGIRIPLVVMGPGFEVGSTRNDLVLQLDMAATSLALAGIPIPPAMEARDLFAADFEPRRYVVSARDRSGETVDRIRSVRTERFKYILNHHVRRPYLQPNSYMDHKVIVMRLRQLHDEGRLDETQSLVLANERPREELYDLDEDPWEIENLAGLPEHAATLQEMRRMLEEWTRAGDRGASPEAADTYEAEVEAFARRVRNPVKRAAIRANAELMKRWAAEGR